MDDFILASKQYSALARLDFAHRAGNREKVKRLSMLSVILERMEARNAINDMLVARDALREMKRAVQKAKKSGVVFALAGKRVEALETAFQKKMQELAQEGGHIAEILDMWQMYGANLKDLCNLCNRDYEQVKSEIKAERFNEPFSSLIFVYNLDYKDNRNRGWIDEAVDAPLTHSIKEYYLDQMLHTSEGRKASHEAMEACFPGIMENALRLVTDADGVKRLIDKDGVDVGIMGEED